MTYLLRTNQFVISLPLPGIKERERDTKRLPPGIQACPLIRYRSSSTAFAFPFIGRLVSGLFSCIGAAGDVSVITAGVDETESVIPIAPNAARSPRRAFDQAMMMRWVASALEMFPHSSQKASRSLKAIELFRKRIVRVDGIRLSWH